MLLENLKKCFYNSCFLFHFCFFFFLVFLLLFEVQTSSTECKRTRILKKLKMDFYEKLVFDLFLTSLGRFAYFRSYAGFVGSDGKIIFELVCFSAKKLYFCCITNCITFFT